MNITVISETDVANTLLAADQSLAPKTLAEAAAEFRGMKRAALEDKNFEVAALAEQFARAIEGAQKRMVALEAVAATLNQFVADGYVIEPETLKALRELSQNPPPENPNSAPGKA